MTRLELGRIVDSIMDIAESERDEDLKLEMICMELIENLDLDIKEDE